MNCANCDGEKTIVLLNSIFLSDGFRRERCGICAGTGISNYQPDPSVLREQKRLRKMFATYGARGPKPPWSEAKP